VWNDCSFMAASPPQWSGGVFVHLSSGWLCVGAKKNHYLDRLDELAKRHCRSRGHPDMRTKILFVIDGMEYGGGERVFAQMIKYLPRDRYDLYLAAGNNGTLYRAIAPTAVKCYPINFSNRYDLTIPLKLIKIVKENRISIIHGQGARAEFFARLASRLSGRCRYVSTIAMPVENFDVKSVKKILYGLLDGSTERFVDRFIVVSAALEKTMIGKHGISPMKVVRIHNGIETDYYKPTEAEKKPTDISRFFLNEGHDLLIGAAGRMVWQKGFEFFLACMPELIRDRQGLRFVIIGDGPLRLDLEQQARSLGIDHQVVFTGALSDIRDMMAAMDIFVIPSLLEGFPMVTLEAMAMEKTIVATAIDGIREQITDGLEGLLVPPKDPSSLAKAIKRLVDEPAYARSLGRNARGKAIRYFSVQKMIQETMKVYDTL